MRKIGADVDITSVTYQNPSISFRSVEGRRHNESTTLILEVTISLNHNEFLIEGCQMFVFLLSESLVILPGTFHLLVLKKTLKILSVPFEKYMSSQPYYKIVALAFMGIRI